jgi:hypothetical protein
MERVKSSASKELGDEELAKLYCQQAVDGYRLKGQVNTKKLVALARKINHSNLSNKHEICQLLLGGLSPNHLDEVSLKQFREFTIGESFTAAMVWQTALGSALWRERGKPPPAFVLRRKTVGRRFAELLGLRLPQLYQAEIPASAIEIRPNCVVKPTFEANSRGVFLMRDLNCILDVRAKEYFNGELELRARIDARLKSEIIRQDIWQVEELVPTKAGLCPMDVKFLTFYGRVGLILEVRRHPTAGYNWYNTSGQQIITGKHEGLEFEGEGVSADEANFAAKLSLEIPLPFMRIDFLRSADGSLIFCEFTSRPGQFEKFDGATDVLLGREYIAASARLHDDALNGKSFKLYSQLCAEGGFSRAKRPKSSMITVRKLLSVLSSKAAKSRTRSIAGKSEAQVRRDGQRAAHLAGLFR